MDGQNSRLIKTSKVEKLSTTGQTSTQQNVQLFVLKPVQKRCELWHVHCNVKVQGNRPNQKEKENQMVQVLKLQTLKSRTNTVELEQFFMSTASGICPTGNAE